MYRQEFINGELFLRRGIFSLEEENTFTPNFLFLDSCSKIYQVATNENGVYFRTRNNDGKLSAFKKTNYEKIEKELIPLSNYLLHADYLGLPASINCIDENNNQKIINGVILYKNSAFLLVYDKEPTNLDGKTLPLKVIDNDSFVSYVVTGEKTDIYSDPKNLYHDLFIEILEITKDMNNKGRQK